MFKKTMLAKSLLLAFGSTATLFGTATMAQQNSSDQPAQLQRVEVTGSAIKRIDAETAVPITVIKLDDLRKEGVTTVEQVLSRISSSQSQTGTSQAVGSATGGAAYADLRGLGSNKTLVLLNGRRVANNAIDGASVDLNVIPFAALERVEILRDGASSLYGTDAIGGVINFITRKDFTGGSITLGADSPQHDGGKAYNANIAYGFGTLENDGFNVLGIVDFQKQRPVGAIQRDYSSTGFLPNRGIFRSSGSPDPANYSQGGPSANPAGPACNANSYIFHQSGSGCRYDFVKWVDLIPNTERASGLLKGSLKLTPDHTLNLEYFATQILSKTTIAPVPFAALKMDPGTPFFPGNGMTPAPANFVIDPTKSINIRWRDVPNGPRQEEDKNVQQRLVASVEGIVAGWDYNAGIAYNENKNTHNVTGGYADGTIITSGVKTGAINPFGAQTAAGQALLDSALVRGILYSGKSTVVSADAHASREVGDWLGAGRQAAVAIGAEFRREKTNFQANPAVAELLVASTGIDPTTDQGGSRKVAAVYGEINIPLTKELEVTGALRYDKYSDFGSTTNPKAGFRYQPIEQVLIRGSYSTGFRAPSLYELNNPQTYTNTANSFNDPKRCPNGVPVAGAATDDVCNTQFIVQNGGNKELKPEKAKNLTFGLVFEPVKDLTVGFDFWWIKLRDQVSVLPDTLIFADPTKYAGLFRRAADGSLSIDGSQCPGVSCGYIVNTNDNLGEVRTHGVDLSASYRLRAGDIGTFNFGINGTYVTKYEYQQEQGGVFLQNAGTYSGTGPIFRWAHTLNATWTKGVWGLGVVNRFKTGYHDQNDPNQVSDPQFYGDVASYSVWDVSGSWAPVKTLSFTLGIRNVFDKEPPFSNQARTFQSNFDPRFTDPTGRSFYVRGTYNF